MGTEIITVITEPIHPDMQITPMEEDFEKGATPISVAYLQYAKCDTGYTVKALKSETMIECANRYDAMIALRKEAMGAITADSAHVNSTNWVARDLKDEFSKAMGNDSYEELKKKHDILHEISDEDVTKDQAYLHHFMCQKASELGSPIECDGGALSQPVIVKSDSDISIKEALDSGLISQGDASQASNEGITSANVVTMMDGDGTYAIIIPIESEKEEPMDEISKALGFGNAGITLPLLDFLKAKTPKILTEVVDGGKPDQYTLAPYYIPNTLDGHNEWVETRDLEKAVNEWSLMSPNRNVFLQHDENVVAGTWTQLIVMPWEFDCELKQADGSTVKESFPVGTVLIGVVWKDWAWEMIIDGRITGMSMGGMAIEKEETPPPLA